MSPLDALDEGIFNWTASLNVDMAMQSITGMSSTQGVKNHLLNAGMNFDLC